MYIESNKFFKYTLLFLLTVIGVTGYFYSDYTSSGGGYYYNLIFLFVVGVYAVISFLLMYKYKMDFVGYLIVSPVFVLFIDYIFKGYQMFNIYPLILFVVLFFIGYKIKFNFNPILLNNLGPFLIAYFWLFLSVLYTIVKFGYVTDVSRYWLLILFPIIIFILSLILYSLQKVNIEKTHIISYIYNVFFLINILIIGRFIYFLYIFNSNSSEIYKRLFAFPSMSTSNYTISILTILFFYIYANKEYISLRVLRLTQLFLIMSLIFSQSRGALFAFIVTFTIMFFSHLITKMRKKNIYIVRVKIIIGSFILSILALLVLVFWDNLIGFILTINITQRVESLFSGYDANTVSRFGFWIRYITDFKNGNLIEMLFGKGLSGSINQEIVRPHNIYVLLLNQVGIIGLVIFIFAWIKVAIKLTKLSYVIVFLLLQSFVEPILITVWTETLLLIFIFIESQYKNYNEKQI